MNPNPGENKVVEFPSFGVDVFAREFFERGLALEIIAPTEALSFYRQALRQSSKFVSAIQNTGALYYRLGNKIAAEENFRKVLEIDEGDISANFNMGLLLEGLGDEKETKEKAIHHYLRAIKSSPEYSDAILRLANLYDRMGQVSKAIFCLKKYLRCPTREADEVERIKVRLICLNATLGSQKRLSLVRKRKNKIGGEA